MKFAKIPLSVLRCLSSVS